MFSTHNFYHILYCNLIKPCNSIRSLAFDHNLDVVYASKNYDDPEFPNGIIWYDQEPIFEDDLFPRFSTFYDIPGKLYTIDKPIDRLRTQCIVANSEISEMKNKMLNDLEMLDWYYFSHGLISLDWFRDFEYLPIDKSAMFDKVFIMFNHLTSKYRSYRLGLVADIMHRGILDKGLVSLPLNDPYHGHFTSEVFSHESMLSVEHKKLILKTIKNLSEPLIIDSAEVNGTFSAKLDLSVTQRAFWHVVTETIFYQPKLHLTEKIFKPIVSYRPFILAGATGNLKYLRSYGFKTFGDFIDESYDLETNNERRMIMIVDEIEKLSKLTTQQQHDMFEAMKPILEHNFNHFYGDFKKIVVDEMVYGFGECIDGYIDDSNVDYAAVVKTMTK